MLAVRLVQCEFDRLGGRLTQAAAACNREKRMARCAIEVRDIRGEVRECRGMRPDGVSVATLNGSGQGSLGSDREGILGAREAQRPDGLQRRTPVHSRSAK